MAPGEVGGVADENERDAEQAGSGDVELAGDRELRLVEALGVDPREVRVTEEHAVLVVGRAGRTDGDRVGPHLAHRLVPADGEEASRAGGIDRGHRGRVARRGRRRLGNAGHDDVLTGEQRQLVEAQVGVLLSDRMHPRSAVAARVLDPARPADVVQPAVVAGDVTAHPGAQRGRDGSRPGPDGEQLVDGVHLSHGRPEDVAVEVGDRDAVAPHLVRRGRAEPPRSLTLDAHVVRGHDAQVVLGERVAVAVADAAEVLAHDVRDAVLGPGDGDVVAVMVARRGGWERERGEHQHGGDEGESSMHAGALRRSPTPSCPNFSGGGSGI